MGLRVHVITQEDPLFLPFFFREFFARLPAEEIEVTGVDVSPALNRTSTRELAARVWALFGPVGTVAVAREWVVGKVADRLLPLSLYDGSLDRLCRRAGVPCRPVAKVNAPPYVEELRAKRPDILLSVAASQVFKEGLLGVARRGALNVHTGRLPRYRGMMPVFWQLLHDEPSVVVTVHTMAAELDMGEVVLEHEVPVAGEYSLAHMIRRAKIEGARASIAALRRYAAGEVSTRPIGSDGKGYFSWPTAADARALRGKGWSIP